jgi:phosphoglycolate phosphatase
VELLLRRALPAPLGDDEATVAACVREMRASYGRDRTRAYPGIAELLDELVARGVALAVLSNKAEELVRPLVAELLGRWRFAAVRGARPGAPKKPDPAEALAIARALALAPDQVLYLGDSGIDMQTAVAAGMFPVGALWGFRAADELRAGGARALCARPEELLALLGSSWK